MLKFTSKKASVLTLLAILLTLTFTINAHEKKQKGPLKFVPGIKIELKSGDYYFRGPPIDPNDLNGATDIPGHEWVRVGKRRLLGKHYNLSANTGTYANTPYYWTDDVETGGLLWYVDAVIDTWTEQKALQYYIKGYVRYSALLNADTRELHPTKVVWLKHVAATEFTFDGDIPTRVFCKIEPYDVKFGVDYQLCPNWDTPFNP